MSLDVSDLPDVASVVQRLRSKRRAEQRHGLNWVVTIASQFPQFRDPLVAAGCLPLLVGLLASGRAQLMQKAGLALCSLGEAAHAAYSGSTISSLVALLSHGDAGVRECAVTALEPLLHCPELGQHFIAAGAARPLVRMCAFGSMPMQRQAAIWISRLAVGEDSCAALADAGATTAMLQVLSVHCRCTATLLCGTRALAAFFACSPVARAEAASAGLAALVNCCYYGMKDVRLHAAQALMGLLAWGTGDACAAVAAAGGVAALAALLSRSGSETRSMAAAALGHLTLGSSDAAVDMLDTGCLARLLLSALEGASTMKPEAARLTQHAAVNTVLGLAALDAEPELAAAVVEAGAVPALAALLQAHHASADHALLQKTAMALHALAEASQGQAVLRARVVAPLGCLRSDSPSPLVQQSALDALRSLGLAAADLPRSIQRAAKMCAACCATDVHLRSCASCLTVRYCSQECQHAHWGAHRSTCRRLQAETAAASQP